MQALSWRPPPTARCVTGSARLSRPPKADPPGMRRVIAAAELSFLTRPARRERSNSTSRAAAYHPYGPYQNRQCLARRERGPAPEVAGVMEPRSRGHQKQALAVRGDLCASELEPHRVSTPHVEQWHQWHRLNCHWPGRAAL